jgi:hypothetical protein
MTTVPKMPVIPIPQSRERNLALLREQCKIGSAEQFAEVIWHP